MKEIKGIESLREILHEFEQAIVYNTTEELKRIKRTVFMCELDFEPFSEEVKYYITSIRLDENKSPVLDIPFAELSEKYFTDCISDKEISHWNMIALLEQLQQIPYSLKTYTLKGRNGRKNISFTIDDLIPIPSTYFDFDRLAKLINDSEYEPDYENQMQKNTPCCMTNPNIRKSTFSALRTRILSFCRAITVFTRPFSKKKI